MALLDQGRKYAMTVVYLFIACVLVLIESFVLALAGKLSGEWMTICTIFLPSVAAATIGFQVTNTMNTTKALEMGAAPPPPPESG